MRDVAALFIIGVFVIVLVMSALMLVDDSSHWSTYRSPDTGICYEVRIDAALFGFFTAMSPVDDSFCEDK